MGMTILGSTAKWNTRALATLVRKDNAEEPLSKVLGITEIKILERTVDQVVDIGNKNIKINTERKHLGDLGKISEMLMGLLTSSQVSFFLGKIGTQNSVVAVTSAIFFGVFGAGLSLAIHKSVNHGIEKLKSEKETAEEKLDKVMETKRRLVGWLTRESKEL